VNDKLATDPEEAFQWWEYILSITLALNKWTFWQEYMSTARWMLRHKYYGEGAVL
jgi:hypothetical protein